MPARSRPTALLEQPSYLASQVSKYGRRLVEEALAERGLGLLHYAALATLDDLGALSQQQLASSLDYDKSHLVAHLDHLEARGLVQRVRDPADRRRNQLHITDDGRAVLAELHPVGRESQRGLLDALTPDEQATLVSLLRRVLEAKDAERLASDG